MELNPKAVALPTMTNTPHPPSFQEVEIDQRQDGVCINATAMCQPNRKLLGYPPDHHGD